MPKLIVTAGPTAGLEYPVKENVILGRDPRSQVLIATREVSAQHARITRVGTRYYLEDLRSRNGTFLNDRTIQREELQDGDTVRIGRTTFRFELRVLERDDARRASPVPETHITVELDATRDVFLLNSAPVASGARRQEHLLKLLCNLSRSIGSLSGLKATLDEIGVTLLELFQQASRVMILLSSDGSNLEPMVTRWRGEPLAGPVQYSDTIVRKALTERRAFLTVDALSDDRFSASRSVLDLRLRSLMCVPILHRDRVLGVVEIDTLATTRMFTEEDLNLMTGVVAQLAFAVANAALYDELRGMAAGVVSSLTAALGLRSPATLAHCERVSRFALAMARRLELPAHEVEVLRTAALLHDIGLLGMPEGEMPGSSPGSDPAGAASGSTTSVRPGVESAWTAGSTPTPAAINETAASRSAAGAGTAGSTPTPAAINETAASRPAAGAGTAGSTASPAASAETTGSRAMTHLPHGGGSAVAENGFVHYNQHHADGLMVDIESARTDRFHLPDRSGGRRTPGSGGMSDGLRGHPERAGEILGSLKPLAPALTLILAHHERHDGGGYPRGLSGTDIPLGARILAIADAFDAMTAFSYYQPARSPEAALEVLRAEAGRQFDPELVALFGLIWEARQRLEARRSG